MSIGVIYYNFPTYNKKIRHPLWIMTEELMLHLAGCHEQAYNQTKYKRYPFSYIEYKTTHHFDLEKRER